MNNEVAVKTTSTELAENIDYKAKALEYLASMGNRLPQKQQTLFLEMAQGFGLNPFKREIYAVGYGENWNIITGYEVYLKRAERIGKLDGWNATIAGTGDNMTATVTIYRKDWTHPFTHTVLFSEVANKTKDGRLNSVWAKMPSFMCKKVAIAQAFRLCFPDEMGGMPYTSDEISVDEMKIAEPVAEPVVTVEEKAAPAKKYTKEQADEVGRLIAAFPEIFTDEVKLSLKKMLVEVGGEAAIRAAQDFVSNSNKGAPTETEEQAIDAIF